MHNMVVITMMLYILTKDMKNYSYMYLARATCFVLWTKTVD